MASKVRLEYHASSYARDPRAFLSRARAGLAQSFDIARLLFVANMRSRYRRALLGYVWLVLPALATALIFTVLRRSNVFFIAELDMPYTLFVLSGVLLWQCFSDALVSPANHSRQHAEFLALVPAPFEGVVLAALFDVVLNSAIRVAVALLAAALFGFAPSAGWITGLVPAALLLVVAGFALGLCVAPLAQLYVDVANLLALIGTFGLFLVPAIYPIPADSALALNPLVAAMDWARGGMLGAAGQPPWGLMAFCVLLVPVAWLLNVAARPHLSARTG